MTGLHTQFSDFTLQYFEHIRRRLPFVVHSNREMAHRRKKSGQVRINSGQVDLSRHALTNSHYFTYTFLLKGQENVLFELGSKRVITTA